MVVSVFTGWYSDFHPSEEVFLRRLIVTTIIMLSFGLSLSFGQSGDEAGIKKLNDDYANAIKDRDVKAALACHTADAVRATGSGVAVGSAKIEAALTEQFANAQAGNVELTLHNTNMITSDVAIVHGGFKTANGSGHFIRTLVKKGGSWKIAAIQIAADQN